MRAILALEDGVIFKGHCFTGSGQAEGEVIFNTGMSGYQEILTDPSYCRQMVCMTYPHIGNYGINLEDVESDRVQVAAFIVKECCSNPSNWRSKESLPDYLKRHNVLGLEGIDTRALTRHIRIHGAMRGVISTLEEDPQKLVHRARSIPGMEGQNLVEQVSTKTAYIWDGQKPQAVEIKNGKYKWPGPGPKVVAYDLGIKWNILRLLQDQGLDLLVIPSSYTAAQVKDLEPEAVFLSNGPGDPAALPDIVHNVALLANDYPLAGICLGHQLLGLALGGKSYKLKFGHHGINHPVQNLETRQIEISSQNHGFCVDVAKLDNLRQTHINLNDQTLEGFCHNTKPIIGVQYHPEAGPGPHDSRYFFSRFKEMIKSNLVCN